MWENLLIFLYTLLLVSPVRSLFHFHCFLSFRYRARLMNGRRELSKVNECELCWLFNLKNFQRSNRMNGDVHCKTTQISPAHTTELFVMMNESDEREPRKITMNQREKLSSISSADSCCDWWHRSPQPHISMCARWTFSHTRLNSEFVSLVLINFRHFSHSRAAAKWGGGCTHKRVRSKSRYIKSCENFSTHHNRATRNIHNNFLFCCALDCCSFITYRRAYTYWN